MSTERHRANGEFAKFVGSRWAVSRLISLLFGTCGCAQTLCQRLQELPGDCSVPLDQRTELPKGEPVADQVGRSGNRGGAGAAVDQRDLTEVIARAEGGEFDALARDPGLPGVDEEEGGTTGTLHDHSLALREAAFLEEAGNLLRLPAIHAGHGLDPLDGSHGIAPGRDRRWHFAVRLAGRYGATLEEVEHAILERPFDVAARAIDFFASESQFAQGRELDIVEAKLVHVCRRHLLLESAPARQGANCDPLAPGLALQHPTGAVEPKVVGDDQAGNHRSEERRVG